jgi:hypothetical protein
MYVGRAIAQTVNRWFPTAESRFEPGSGQVRFVVDKVVLGQIFSEHFRFPCNLYSTNFSILTQPHGTSTISGRHAEWTQFRLKLPLCELKKKWNVCYKASIFIILSSKICVLREHKLGKIYELARFSKLWVQSEKVGSEVRSKMLWRINPFLSCDSLNNNRSWATARRIGSSSNEYTRNNIVTLGSGMLYIWSVPTCYNQFSWVLWR